MAAHIKTGIVLLTALLITSCTSIHSTLDDELPWYFLPLAVPIQPSLEQEIKLNQIDTLLTSPASDSSNQEKAMLFFERGLVNDSLGLRDIAYTDFSRSLSLNPIQPQIFTIIGNYYILNSLFDEAYEAFDSALELQPDNTNVQNNLAVALYYGKRYQLAERELLSLTTIDQDSYRSLWLYLIKQQTAGQEQAQALLQTRYDAKKDNSWRWQVARLLLDQISEEELFTYLVEFSQNNQQLAEVLCETYFFLAKHSQSNQQINSAIVFYKLALSTNLYASVEHRYSLLELNLIAQGNEA